MTAKQYLQQAYRLNDAINTLMRRRDDMRLRATSIPAVDTTRDCVQGGGEPDKIAALVAKLVDFDAMLTAQIDKYVDLQLEIGARIDRVPDAQLRLILQKRYLNFDRWERIAQDMGYTERHITRMHGTALSAFLSQNKDVLECPI